MKTKNRYKEFKKYVAAFLTISFINSQVLPLSMANVTLESDTPLEQKYSATTTVAEQEAKEVAQNIQEAVSASQTSINDLISQDELVLTPAEESSNEETEKEVEETTAASQNDQVATPAQPTTFEKALEYLKQAKGFAVAVVKSILESDIAELAKQAYEYGLTVVKGVILLFTSHEENSLSTTAEFAKKLNEESSLVIHSQPDQKWASLLDLEGAQKRAEAQGKERDYEYVISTVGNAAGVNVVRFDSRNIDDQQDVAVSDLANLIAKSYDPTQGALDEIYQLVRAQETADPALLELFRSDPPTNFSGLPELTSFASQSPAGSISNNQTSASNFITTYDVSNGSFVGTGINWGVTSAGYADLSGFSKYSFEVKRSDTLCASVSTTCNFVEFKDTAGRVAKVRFTNIGTTFVQKDIPKTSLQANNPNIDFTKIKEINFVWDSQTPSTGVMEVNTGGLAFDPTLNPDGTNPTITAVPVNSLGNRPALTGFASNDFSTVEVTTTSHTQGSLTINQYNTTSFGGAFLAYDDPSTTGTVETINFSSLFSSGLVLQLNDGGTGVTKVKFELTDNTGKTDYVTLTGITGSDKRWKILPSNFDEIDVTKIKTIALVTEGRMTGKTLNYEWGNFFFVPSVNPASGNPDITYVPGNYTGGRPAFTAFASQDFSNNTVNQLSATFAQINFNQYNTTSFGGAFLAYDDPSTTGTVETINYNTTFPNGLTMQLDSPDGISEVIIELTDNTGKKDKVKLTGITTTGNKYTLPYALFDEIDTTKIQSIALVTEGRYINKNLNVDWGKFAFVPSVPEDTNNPAITPIPVNSQGNRPVLTGFDGDVNIYDNVNAVALSKTFAQITFNQYNTASYGGAFLAYDDPSTTGTVETINYNTTFPNGLSFQLDSPDGITEVIVELTDNTGKKDKVKLTGIASTGKKYTLLSSVFDEIDMTKIQTISLVLEGNYADKHLNVDWGNFYYVPSVPEDTNNPAITYIPVDSLGNRPTLSGFASQDFSNVTATALSATFASLTFNQYNTSSFGGAFLAYDNPATTGTVETFNYDTTFPNGLSLQLDSADGITEIIVELTDDTGKKDKVKLTGIGTTGKKYTLLSSIFDEIDTTKIQTISLVLEGRYIDKHLNVDWGRFAFVPSVPEDTNNPAITPIPVNSQGNRPVLTGFDGDVNIYDNVTANALSKTFAQITFNQYNTASYGGAFLAYDDPSTTGTVETINYNTTFPNGLSFQLDSPDGITEVIVELTDNTGKKDKVKLTGIASTGKKYTLLSSVFDEIDMTKIQTISFVLEGYHAGDRLNVDWGNFYYVPSVGEDTNNPAITFVPNDSLGNRPELTSFASNDFSNVSASLASPTFATLTVNQYNSASFGGVFLNYDNAATTGTVETFNYDTTFPSGLSLQLDSADGISEVIVELTDNTGKKDKVKLTGISATGKKFTLLSSLFDEIDTTKIQTISLVLEGRYIDKHLNLDWGLFAFVPSIAVDGSNPAVTTVPSNYAGRPTFTAFSSQDFSNTSVVGSSASAGRINFNLYNTTSFGGAFIAYDDPSTTGTVESINFNTAFPTGLVLGLSSQDGITETLVEFTDADNKRYKVKLTGITDTEGRYKILASNLDSALIDVTKIISITILETGKFVGKSLDYNWGLFTFTPSITNDPSNPNTTPVPANYAGRPTFTGFASQDFSNVFADPTSKSTGSIYFNLYNTTSFGGAFINYDDPSTSGTVESINFNTAFASGLVLGLSSPDGITEAFVEFADATGKRYSVKLTDITTSENRYKILASHLDSALIDITKITSITVLEIGRYVGKTLNYNWGDFAFIPSISSASGTPAITQLPNTSTGQPAELVGFSSSGSSAIVDATTTSNATVTFNLQDANAFGGAFLSFDDRLTEGTTETIDLEALFPSGIVLGLNNAGTNLTSIRLEVTDINGKKDSVRLIDILDTAKRWNIPVGSFDEVDTTKIKTIAFVLEGAADDLILDIDWGLWQVIPAIP